MNLTQWKNNGALGQWLQERIKAGSVTLTEQDPQKPKTFAEHMVHGICAGAVLGVSPQARVTHVAHAHFSTLGRSATLGFFNLCDVGTESGYISGCAVRIVRPNGELVMDGNHDLSPMELLSLLEFATQAQRRHLEQNAEAGVQAAADVLRKHEEALAGLLYRAHEEAEVLAGNIATQLGAGCSPYGREDAERWTRNTKHLASLLYALYGYNSEEGTTTEQQLLLHRCGFDLDPVPVDPVVMQRRTALANLMRTSVEQHYPSCPAETGGACECTWLADGDVLRSWLEELAPPVYQTTQG